MGKHLWMKHLDKEKQQPGCMSGLVHVFDYRHWHSNVRKMIRHRELHDHCKHLFDQLLCFVYLHIFVRFSSMFFARLVRFRRRLGPRNRGVSK